MITVEKKHDNGGWFVQGDNWIMQPEGQITAIEAHRICNVTAMALRRVAAKDDSLLEDLRVAHGSMSISLRLRAIDAITDLRAQLDEKMERREQIIAAAFERGRASVGDRT